jgi:hypothetical protein
MAMPTKPRKPVRAGTGGRTERTNRSRQAATWVRGEDDPFDVWLRQSLHDAFDAIAAEPIPEDVLQLIEEDRAEREQIRQRRATKQGKK